MPVFLSEIRINTEALTVPSSLWGEGEGMLWHRVESSPQPSPQPSPLKRERGRNVPVFLSETRINTEALTIPSPLWGEG